MIKAGHALVCGYIVIDKLRPQNDLGFSISYQNTLAHSTLLYHIVSLATKTKVAVAVMPDSRPQQWSTYVYFFFHFHLF